MVIHEKKGMAILCKIPDKMHQPKVSICIPVFNGEQYIEACIRSCMEQDYEPISIICIDNQSTDQTWEIVKGLAAADKRIKCFQNVSNIGMFNNVKKVLEYADSEFVTILSADDYLYPKAISTQVNQLLQYPSAAFAFSNIDQIGHKFNCNTNYSYPNYFEKGSYVQLSFKMAKNLNFLTATLFRRDQVDISTIPNLIFFDWYIWLTLGLQHEVVFTEETLGTHRYHDANQTEELCSTYLNHYLSLKKVLDACWESHKSYFQGSLLTQWKNAQLRLQNNFLKQVVYFQSPDYKSFREYVSLFTTKSGLKPTAYYAMLIHLYFMYERCKRWVINL